MFHWRETLASSRFTWSEVTTHPVDISSLFMKLTRAVRMVSIFHTGFQVSGWKSEIERQMRFSGQICH